MSKREKLWKSNMAAMNNPPYAKKKIEKQWESGMPVHIETYWDKIADFMHDLIFGGIE